MVELSELVAGVPSGLFGAGVVCLVSLLVVLDFSSDELAGGGEVTTVAGGGVCWQPTSIRAIPIAANAGTYFLVNIFIVVESSLINVSKLLATSCLKTLLIAGHY